MELPDLPVKGPARALGGFLLGGRTLRLMMIRLSGSVTVFGLIAAGIGLSGCMSSPTYGTGTTANAQLLDDVTSFGRITPQHGPKIDYKPRPALVATTTADAGPLPKPQSDVTDTTNTAEWPESPEQRRPRLRAEATANQDNPNYRPKIGTDGGGGTAVSPALLAEQNKFSNSYMSSASQRAEFKRRLAEGKQGSPTQRKYLSEPPLQYRQPAATAPINDIGEDEAKKERERKAAAKKKDGKSSWGIGSLFSWL